MIFSNFERIETDNKIIFKNLTPILNVASLKFYKDDASGVFTKKEFRWSFNDNYWSSWETLNQGNLTSLSVNGKQYLFLEIRYVPSGSAKVTSFQVNYLQSTEPIPEEIPTSTPTESVACPTDYGDSCGVGKQSTFDADLLNGKPGSFYLWRPNHQGEQPISSVTGLQTILTNLSWGIQDSITNGSNVDGDGIGVFYEKSEQNLVFKRIDGGVGAEVTESDGIITISVDASSAKDPSINELYDFYYSLEADLYDLSIYIDAKFVQVDASLNDLYNITTDLSIYDSKLDASINKLFDLDSTNLKGAENVGTGTGEVFKQIDTSNFAQFRTILGAGDVSISTQGDEIVIFIDASVNVTPDPWTDTDPVSATVGGISGGDYVPLGSSPTDVLEKILYEYFPPDITFNIDPPQGYYEKWQTAYDVSMYGTFNNSDFVKVSVTDVSAYDSLSGGIGHISYPDVSYGAFGFLSTGNSNWDDVIYSVKIFNKVGGNYMEPEEASLGISYVPPYIWGMVNNTVDVNNIDASIIEHFHDLGQKIIVPEQTNEVDYIRPVGMIKAKFVYAYDVSYGDLTSIFDVRNDFNVTTSFDNTIVNGITLGAGSNLSYKVYIKSHWIDVSTFKLVYNI